MKAWKALLCMLWRITLSLFPFTITRRTQVYAQNISSQNIGLYTEYKITHKTQLYTQSLMNIQTSLHRRSFYALKILAMFSHGIPFEKKTIGKVGTRTSVAGISQHPCYPPYHPLPQKKETFVRCREVEYLS